MPREYAVKDIKELLDQHQALLQELHDAAFLSYKLKTETTEIAKKSIEDGAFDVRLRHELLDKYDETPISPGEQALLKDVYLFRETKQLCDQAKQVLAFYEGDIQDYMTSAEEGTKSLKWLFLPNEEKKSVISAIRFLQQILETDYPQSIRSISAAIHNIEDHSNELVLQTVNANKEKYLNTLRQILPKSIPFDQQAPVIRELLSEYNTFNGEIDRAESLLTAMEPSITDAVNKVASHEALRILRDNQTKESSNLLRHVYEYKEKRKVLDQANQIRLEHYQENEKQEAVLQDVGCGVEWLLLPDSQRENIKTSYADLSELINGSYRDSIRMLRNSLADNSVNDAVVWDDFQKDAVSYFSIIEKILPGYLSKDKTIQSEIDRINGKFGVVDIKEIPNSLKVYSPEEQNKELVESESAVDPKKHWNSLRVIPDSVSSAGYTQLELEGNDENSLGKESVQAVAAKEEGQSGLNSYIQHHVFCKNCHHGMILAKGRKGKTYIRCDSCNNPDILDYHIVNQYIQEYKVVCPEHETALKAGVSRYGLYIRCVKGHFVPPEKI